MRPPVSQEEDLVVHQTFDAVPTHHRRAVSQCQIPKKKSFKLSKRCKTSLGGRKVAGTRPGSPKAGSKITSSYYDFLLTTQADTTPMTSDRAFTQMSDLDKFFSRQAQKCIEPALYDMSMRNTLNY